VAEGTDHKITTVFVGFQPRRALGSEAADLEGVSYRAVLKDAVCGAALAAFWVDRELVPGSASFGLTCTLRVACAGREPDAARFCPRR